LHSWQENNEQLNSVRQGREHMSNKKMRLPNKLQQLQIALLINETEKRGMEL
jgi:hypothetical protein